MTITEYNLAVDNYSDRLYRFVLKSIKDVHAAQDIVQDSYEKLWKNRENVDGKKVKSYLFTTAYHTMIDRIRKEKRSTFSEELNLKEESHENNSVNKGSTISLQRASCSVLNLVLHCISQKPYLQEAGPSYFWGRAKESKTNLCIGVPDFLSMSRTTASGLEGR